jgi:hypothetical protein
MTVTNLNLPTVDYTSRDYASLREDLIKAVQARIPAWTASDPSDVGVALVESFAYLGDSLNYYIDRAANEAFLPTATQRQSLIDIANMLGYYPANPIPAYVSSLTISNPTTVAQTLTNGTQFVTTTQTTAGSRTVTFEVILPSSYPGAVATMTVPALGTVTVAAVEGVTVAYDELGVSSGQPDQEFTLRVSPIVEGSLSISAGLIGSGVNVAGSNGSYGVLRYGEVTWSVGPDAYTRVLGYADAGPNTKLFFLRTDANGVSTIRFGDGVNGQIPLKDSRVYATYRIGGGSAGNLPAGTKLLGLGSMYGSLDEASSGGSDGESAASIRRNAASTFRSRNRAVTKQDFADMALTVPGIDKAVARANTYASVTVYVSPTAASSDLAPGFSAYQVLQKQGETVGHTATLVVSGLPPTVVVGGTFAVSGVGPGWDTTAAVVSSLIRPADGTPSSVVYSAPSVSATTLTPCTGVIQFGEVLSFTSAKSDVTTLLQTNSTIGCTVTVSPITYRHANLTTTIYVEPTVRRSVALTRAASVLKSLFDYENLQPGQGIRPQDVVIALAMTTEIGWATVDDLRFSNDSVAYTTGNAVVPGAGELLRILDGNITINFGAGTGINDLS